MDSEQCIFCRRIQSTCTDEEPVWEFSHSVVFLGQWQYYCGYSVVVSKRHASELFTLAKEERREFLEEMSITAQAIHDAFQPRKLNYELLGNQVPHLHWHLFPRYPSDPDRLKPVWIALEHAEQSLDEKKRLEGDPRTRRKTIQALRESIQKARGA